MAETWEKSALTGSEHDLLLWR